jgi:hypothetical protein
MTVTLAYFSRGLTFFFDEWDFLLRRRTLSIDELLAPHNGHLSAIPAAMFMSLSAVFGVRSYAPYLCLLFALHISCTLVMFRCTGRRAGPTTAAVLAGVLLTLGRAWQDLLWPFQCGFLLSLTAGLGALVCLEDDRTRRLPAALCLGTSLASSGLGVPVLVAVSTDLLLRRRYRLLLSVAAVPAVGYALWYLSYGTSEASWANAHLVPGYVGRAASGAVGSVIGTDPGLWSSVVAGAVAVSVVVLTARRSFAPRLGGAIAGALAFWALAALARGPFGEPTASRYLYPGAVFVLLIVAEVLGHLRPLRRWSPATVVAIIIAVLAGASNLDRLRIGAAELRDISTFVRAELGALELARGAVPPEFQPDTARMPQVSAGPYLEMVQAFGSPADDVASIRRKPDPVRQAADGVLRRIIASSEMLSVAPIIVDGDCQRKSPGRWTIRPSAGVAELRSGEAAVTLWLRQFSMTFGEHPLAVVAAGQRVRIDFRSLLDSLSPRLEAESAAGLSLCTGEATPAA